MKFSQFLKDPTPVIITEADIFPDVDVIKLDPDRADSHDVVNALMPTLVRMAYVYLIEDKVKYERTHRDEEDTPFEFTEDALDERLESLIEHIGNRLEDVSSHDRKAHIERMSSEFKEKLTESLNEAVNVSEIDIASIKPDDKDVERAKGLEFRGSTFHGNRAPWGSEAAKMAKLIKDPMKLVRRAKAVAQMYGIKPASEETDAWTPFVNALEKLGFSSAQIKMIATSKKD